MAGLSEREMVELVATKVMGYEVGIRSKGGAVYWTTGGASFPWNPLRDLGHAVQVLEHLRPDWEVTVQNWAKGSLEPLPCWLVTIGAHESLSEEFGMAVCCAALRAFGLMEAR